MLADLRFAVRQLTKSPGFTAVAVVTLALGIGGNTAIFSIVNTLLLQPLPYPEAGRLVQVVEQVPNAGFAPASGGVFVDWQDHTTQLESLGALHNTEKNLTGRGDPVHLSGAEVSGDYLHVLRVKPALGRSFVPADDAPGGDRHVIILTHELWQSRFQGDPGIVGRAVHLDGDSYTAIGVLPPAALMLPTIEFLVPATIRADAWKQIRDYNYVCSVIARLKPGATMSQAAAELNASKQALLSSYPAYRQPWTVIVRSLQEATFGNTRPAVFTLLAAVGVVLLIACANVASLLLARASSRQSEIAVRVAMGATAGRVIRQLLTESLLLALLGAAGGILVGAWAIKPLIAFTGLNQLQGLSIGIDQRVLLFSLGAAVVTGLVFGLFPALSAAHPNLVENLKEGARGSSSGSRRRLQSLLVVSETALTVVLLVCAGLLIRSFFHAMNADAGFNRDHVLIFTLNQASNKAPTVDHRARFVSDIRRAIGAIPGVASVGMASSTPMNGRTGYGDFVSREERPETRNDLNAGFDSVDGDLFKALGVPLVRGRFFTAADNSTTAPKVIIVNDALACRLFADEDPIGRLLHFKDATWEIVGVVGNVRQFQLDIDPRPQVYLPQVNFPWYNMIAVRTHVPPLTLVEDIRRAVKSVDPEQPIGYLTTLEQSVDASLRGRRIMLTLLGVFAATALLLACIGLYGVMAYSVAQRTREIGIRIALGAGVRGVIALVLRDGLKLVALGLVIGAAVSYGAARLIANQLYSTSSGDPAVFLLVALILLAVALLACWLPARHATQVDPVTALRAE